MAEYIGKHREPSVFDASLTERAQTLGICDDTSDDLLSGPAQDRHDWEILRQAHAVVLRRSEKNTVPVRLVLKCLEHLASKLEA